jgi:hypothetical protein
MLNHVVMLKFKTDVSTTEIDELEKALDVLPNTIIEIQMLEIGRDVTGSDRSYDFAVIALFANTETLHRFHSHPDYLAVRDKLDMMCENIVTVDFDGTDASDFREKTPEAKTFDDF